MLKIAGIKITNLCKSYPISGKFLPVLNRLNLELDTSGITVILGKSGCGKTTLLRVISGLEHPDQGQLLFETSVKTGIVFQEPRLMPWLNIRQNIAFGLRRSQVQWEHLQHLIEMTGLQGFEEAYPSQLSGGMQQRAALARVLAYDADYILMDEPFAALDYFTRKTMQKELFNIQQANKKGILFVTHSIDEALILGHKLVILEGGVCKKEYELKNQPYPRDLLSPDMIEIKKDIMNKIGE